MSRDDDAPIEPAPLRHWKDQKPTEEPEATPHLKQLFLDNLRERGDVAIAAATCCVEHGIVWKWKRLDKEFSKEWDRIMREELLPYLEAECVRRAARHSDSLLMFLMKAYDRERYDDAIARIKHEPEKKPDINLVITDASGIDMVKARDTLIEKAIDNGVLRPEDLDDVDTQDTH